MIGKQRSQLHGIGKGGHKVGLPRDYSHKIWQLELFDKCGDTIANVFLKIMPCSGSW